VYVGGTFNDGRQATFDGLLTSGPVTSPLSIGGADRNYVAAVDTGTGLATPWNPDADQPVAALAVSGSTVYAGGSFSSIGMQSRNHIAALDATLGQATAWDPERGRRPRAL
jgi:hypothetical protein